ncbi:MAG: GNAT family N-acetyltransferase [Devosia sp.]
MSVEIRLARPDDRLDLIEVLRRASLAGSEPEVIETLRDNPEVMDVDAELIAANEVFVADEDGTVVGFATIIAHDGNDAELEGIFVEPSHWRRGIATALLHQIEREAAAWGATRLHVLAGQMALGFYRTTGFEKVGEQKTEFGPIAFLMVKTVRGQ